MMQLARFISTLLLVASLASPSLAEDRSVPAETYTALQKLQAEEVADLALSLEGGEGSLGAEMRVQALALARKLDPSLKVNEPAKMPMTPEEGIADKALCAAAAVRDQAREDAEKGAVAHGDANRRSYPSPENVRERFTSLRFEIVSDQADFAATLANDPDEKIESPMRRAILKSLPALLGAPRWACEKALAARISALASAPSAPWTGEWSSRIGVWTMIQSGSKVTGSWVFRDAAIDPDGTFVGMVKERTLAGEWRSGSRKGTFSLTLARNGNFWKGVHTDQEGAHPIPHPLEGDRLAPRLTVPAAVVPDPAPKPAPATK